MLRTNSQPCASANPRAKPIPATTITTTTAAAAPAGAPPPPNTPRRPQRASPPRRSVRRGSASVGSGAEVLDRLSHGGVERRHAGVEPLAGQLLREGQRDVVEGDQPRGLGSGRLD